MNKSKSASGSEVISSALLKSQKSKSINYSLRLAKNIERKMMGEAFIRLSALLPLTDYRYIGFGSEFFNDFSLYHQMLGIRKMVSIERDGDRIPRCEFNRPYKCIDVRFGTSGEVLPALSWNEHSIVWLDYTSKLDKAILSDAQFIVSQARSGSLLAWSVNAEPWNGDIDMETSELVNQRDWPLRRLQKLRELVGTNRVRSEIKGSDLAKWGLAAIFYEILTAEINATLNNRNAASANEDKLAFHQCFHYQYSDGQKMLTVGGVVLNPKDSAALGIKPFSGLEFIRSGADPFRIDPPMLTGREVRFLNRLLPHDAKLTEATWLSEEEVGRYSALYRYYPIFAESEL